MKIFQSAYNGLKKFENLILIISIAIITVITIIQVFARYVFLTTFIWVEEITGILMLVIALFGAAVGYREKLHIAMEFFYEKAKGVARGVLQIVISLCSTYVVGALLYSAWLKFGYVQGQSLMTIKAPASIIYVVMIVGAILILLEVLINNIRDIREAFEKHL